MCCGCTDLAAVVHGLDEGAVGLRQLFLVASPEAEGVLVGAGGAVKPAGRVLASVGEVLLGRGAQQFEKGHLDDVHGVPVSVAVGELSHRDTQGDEGDLSPFSVRESSLPSDNAEMNTVTAGALRELELHPA